VGASSRGGKLEIEKKEEEALRFWYFLGFSILGGKDQPETLYARLMLLQWECRGWAATMRGEFEADSPVWIWQTEGSDGAVESDLLNAARRNWLRMLAYAQQYDPDPAVAANILEAVLLATSRARKRRRPSQNPIRNLDNYLYVAFVRGFKRHWAKQPKVDYVGTDRDLDRRKSVQTQETAPTIEDHLVAGEILNCMNLRARSTFFFKEIVGYSWKDTARFLNTTANSAQVLYNKALGRVRDGFARQKGTRRPGKGGRS